MAIDRYDWHFDSAVEIYCDETGKTNDQLTGDDYAIIENRAAAHIGFFIAWIIKHGYIGTETEPSPEAVEAVKNERMTGAEFLMSQCDGKFWDEDVAEEILPFVEKYYERYTTEYSGFISERLGKETYSFEGTWEDYRIIEELIDQLYMEYKK